MAGPLIGNSVAFEEVTKAIAMVAAVDTAVLLLGKRGPAKKSLRGRFTIPARDGSSASYR